MDHLTETLSLYERAKTVIASGCSTPVFDAHNKIRSLLYVKEAQGAHITDVDNNRYIDFICGYGSLIFGHGDIDVTAAIKHQATKGTLYCLPTEEEVNFSDLIVNSTSCIDQVRFTCSGTEAVMTAIRGAKYYTGRSKILRFHGLYHGHSDVVLGRLFPEATAGQFGIDKGAFHNTYLAHYNDLEEVSTILAANSSEIAAVLIEPLACNGGLQLPQKQFLAGLRQLCTQYGVLLIFDEVITGFRLKYGCIADELGVAPDLITFGKVIGGGTPIGAYAGPREIMRYHDSEKDNLHFAGTFAANPLTIAAGTAALCKLADGQVYQHINELGEYFETQVNEHLASYQQYFQLSRFRSIFSLRLLKDGEDYADAIKDYSWLYQQMLKQGVIMTPSPEETMYLSYAHSKNDVNAFVTALKTELNNLINK